MSKILTPPSQCESPNSCPTLLGFSHFKHLKRTDEKKTLKLTHFVWRSSNKTNSNSKNFILVFDTEDTEQLLQNKVHGQKCECSTRVCSKSPVSQDQAPTRTIFPPARLHSTMLFRTTTSNLSHGQSVVSPGYSSGPHPDLCCGRKE